MKKLFFILALSAVVFLQSCGGGKAEQSANNTDQTEQSTDKTIASNTESKGKYPIKSCIIVYKSETMGMPMTITMYFDDFGAKEATETLMETEMMGQKIKSHTIALTKDGYMYNIDFDKKTGSKMKASPNANQNIDYSKLTEQMMKDMKIEKVGTENFLGKSCDIYTMDYSGMKGKTWVWNNIALKSEMEAMGMPIKMEATDVKENATIPTEKFNIPEDIKITEI